MPFGMSGSIHAVVIGGNVYVGGGYNTLKTNKATVMVYSLPTGLWSTLPPYESQYFGMVVMNNQLVLVGGRNISTDRVTNVLGVWDEAFTAWTHPFPEMPISRDLLSVVSYHSWLIVAGGKDQRHSMPIEVQLLDTDFGQWYESSSLPASYSGISSAINGNMWYLSGRYCVFSVCLDELISQALSQSAGITSPSMPSPWQTLTNFPESNSTLLVLSGALLAVGGENSSAIYLYQPSRRSWIKVGDLPTTWWECACTVLPNGETLFVAGGCSQPVRYDRMDIATIKFCS